MKNHETQSSVPLRTQSKYNNSITAVLGTKHCLRDGNGEDFLSPARQLSRLHMPTLMFDLVNRLIVDMYNFKYSVYFNVSLCWVYNLYQVCLIITMYLTLVLSSDEDIGSSDPSQNRQL